MVGTVHQKIFIKALPEGTILKIIQINIQKPDPPEEWQAKLQDAHGNELTAPFDFDPSSDDGLLGDVSFQGLHSFPMRSPGAGCEILWELHEGSDSVAQGRFVAMTTQWGIIERPDYALVLYQVENGQVRAVTSSISGTIIGMPDDVYLLIGKDKDDENKIGVNATKEKEVADTLSELILQGILQGHKLAFGWVKGLFI